MTNNDQMKDEYERPEVMELGAAEELTLGAVGCKDDGTACKFSSQQLEAF